MEGKKKEQEVAWCDSLCSEPDPADPHRFSATAHLQLLIYVVPCDSGKTATDVMYVDIN